MAYAALKSLQLAIDQLYRSSSTLPEVIVLDEEIVSRLQELMKEIYGVQTGDNRSEELMADLDRKIREAAQKLEDVIDESIVSDHCLKDHHDTSFVLSRELQEVLKQEIISFTEMVMEIRQDHYKRFWRLQEMSKMLPEKYVPSIPSGTRSRMIGLDDEFIQIRDKLLDSSLSELKTLSIVGMAGLGKTALARRLFEDPLIRDNFDCLSFVSIGQKYELTEVGKGILAQVMSHDDIDKRRQEDLAYLRRSLKERRYLVVLDDIWGSEPFGQLRMWLPNDRNGSRIVLTTRQHNIDYNLEDYEMRFLNKEESWSLFCEKLFDDQVCPAELEKAGEKIVEKCEGLPLQIITVADHLSKAEKTPEYWNKVAKNPLSIIGDDIEPLSKALRLSYTALPYDYKHCFLYMGVFPQTYKVPASKLIRLWVTENFSSAANVDHYLYYLVSNSLVLPCQKSLKRGIKTWKLHSAYWHLCVNEARKDNLFHVIDSYPNSFDQGTKDQRRLCVHNNGIFGIKPAVGSIQSIPTVRSLLCTGPHHQYPVPICFSWSLLKVVEALTIRFYKFPMEVVELFLLRYLAITYDGNLPSSISKLWNLETLIVCQHLSIISQRGRPYLPMEIWDMQQLKHLQVMGSDMPNPPSGVVLPNLLVLLDVGTRSCTEQVLKSIPNLEKLGIQIDSTGPLSPFDHFSYLTRLRSLKCNVATNPNSRTQMVVLPASVSMFPSSLEKLSLSGFRCPWEQMSIIGELRHLEVLKLRSYAFQGRKWITHREHFKRLEHLVLEDTDLVHWVAKPGCLKSLRSLIIRHCYKLEEIPMEMGHLKSLEMMELVDAKTSLLDLLRKTAQQQGQYERERLQVRVQSSWNDRIQVMPGTLVDEASETQL